MTSFFFFCKELESLAAESVNIADLSLVGPLAFPVPEKCQGLREGQKLCRLEQAVHQLHDGKQPELY